MKRKGFLLLEALMALLLISGLAISVFPLAGRLSGALILGGFKGRMGETGLFAMDFMTEKVRNTEKPSISPVNERFTYSVRNGEDVLSYRLYLDQQKLKVLLYNGHVEPITGEETGSTEEIPVIAGKDGLFRRQGKGPLHMSFSLLRPVEGIRSDFETSILPYADFYEKGKVYE
ncbi:hypothetical protein [Dialister sp.]|uniref:hypothetical protein n=1 Tax=Dialister sp. TaxID=1955814 RepID=UPI002E81E072|nr:hypothetical protein [Dialister sp.]MEE3453535.1 hypothetical protein [Dialister sp.]